MKKNLAIIFMLLVVTTAKAVTLQNLRQMGLPANAFPAMLYFETYYASEKPTATQQDIDNSSFIGLEGEYAFFVQPLAGQADEDFTRIALWMYSEKNKKVSCVFTQQTEEYADLFITGIGWLVDKKPSYRNVVTSDSHQTIRLQEFTDSPVIVLQSEVYNGFSHALRVTLIINPEQQELKRIEGEQFVSVFHTKTNMLMSAEQELAQDYILTTSTEMRTENVPLKESEEYCLYNKQFLTPVIHVYTARGKLVNSIRLPEDEVDMVR